MKLQNCKNKINDPLLKFIKLQKLVPNFINFLPNNLQKTCIKFMSQNYQTLQIVKQLHLIYPDIQGELCSRHSTLFGKLRTTFNKLYDNMQPAHYVIVKGNCQFIEQQFTQLKLSMALQNGIIILVSKTYPTSQIFVNSNHFGQEIIFSHNGKLVEGLNDLSDQLRIIMKDATSNMNQNQLNGGIMYIHANIPQDTFRYKQTFFIAFYLAIMSINDNIKNFSKQDLVKKMSQLKIMGQKQDIQRQFIGFKNRKFNLTLPDLLSVKDRSLNQMNLVSLCQDKEKKQIKLQMSFVQKSQLLLDMNKEFKFLFCKLDLAKEDVNYQFRRRNELKKRKNQLLQELNEKMSISGLFELFHRLNQVKINQIQFSSQYEKSYEAKSLQQIQCQDDYEILKQPNRFLQILLHEIGLVSQFSNQNINLEQLIEAVWQINSKYLKMHSEEVVELVENMKQQLGIKGCMVVNKNFLMIVVHANRYTELICQVKQKMNKGQLKSKSLFKIQDEELVVQRWSSDKMIGEKMFTSVPSEGVGIFDPSQAIWFD